MATTIAHDHSIDHSHDHSHDHAPGGLMRYLTTTNHKDIGTMYLWFAFTMFFIGGAMALGIRAELFRPGLQYFQPEFFNSLTTVHALVMIFGAVMPAFVGFRQLADPDADRCGGHGIPSDEQLELLDHDSGGNFVVVHVFCTGWCGGLWLDFIPTARDPGRYWR